MSAMGAIENAETELSRVITRDSELVQIAINSASPDAVTAEVFDALAALTTHNRTAAKAATLIDRLSVAYPELGKREIRKAISRSLEKKPKPYEVYELNADAVSGTSECPTTLRDDCANPTANRELGQNEIADVIADSLRDSLVWDGTSGCWFERTGVDQPFRERDDPLDGWQAIRTACNHYKPTFSAGFVNGVESFVRADLRVGTWESRRHLLPLTNGVLDLKNRKLRSYSPDDRFNWQLPYAYAPGAKCPLVDKTLSRMVGGDKELERFLIAWLVVVLHGRHDVQAFIELIGDGGTGKSTFVNLTTSLVGAENTVSTDLDSLENNRFETAGLYGKRLILVNDSARFRGNVPVLKAITGGDPVRIERKHQQQRRPYVVTGLVEITANQPLESSDYSSGLQRRRRSISINLRVSEKEKEPYRDRTLYPDGFDGALRAEMPGLLNRLLDVDVDTAVSLIVDPSAAMRAQRLAVELETNALLAWADDELVTCSSGEETAIGDKDKPASHSLYAAYRLYSERRGQEPRSLVRFSRELRDVLKEYGIDTNKDRSKFTFLTGLRLRTVTDADGTLIARDSTMKAAKFEGCVGGLNGANVDFGGFEGCSQTSESVSAEFSPKSNIIRSEPDELVL